MSMTVTQTLHGYVKQTEHESPIDSLVFKMQEAALALPQKHVEEVLQITKEWHALFIKKYKIHSKVESDRIQAAHALLYFRLNTVDYVMNNYAVRIDEKLQWLNIYNDITALVASLLPSHIDVETFIEADEQKQRELRLKLKVLQEAQEIKQLANQVFALLEKLLLQKANQTNSSLKEEFETLKSMLADLNTLKQTRTQELHAKIDRVTQCVFTLYQQLDCQLNDSNQIADEIILSEKHLNLLLDECKTAIDHI